MANEMANTNEKTNENEIVDLSKAISIITELYSKYETDPYMSLRTHNYICNQLPNVFNNMMTTHKNRMQRTEELTCGQDNFIKSFLQNNQYFYVNSIDKFFYYNNFNYKPYSEDEILYHILTSITQNRNIMSWKYKTKTSIMKRIKENSLLTSIPESETIQNVLLSLYPAFFNTKCEAKYFLTIIGDNILKKQSQLIHFLPSSSKLFIRELNNICQNNLGINLLQTIKFKYHEEHEYSNCRMLHFNETIKYEKLWKPILQKLDVDLLCVASHYSTRYESSDEFIINSQNHQLKNDVFYLKEKSIDELVSNFIKEYINVCVQKPIMNSWDELREQCYSDRELGVPNSSSSSSNISSSNSGISWKNLQYLWKHFLQSKRLPRVIYQASLKNILIQKLGNYSEETDFFKNIFSKFLPEIQKFLQFWEETMVEDTNESELEIEEISYLYNTWDNKTLTNDGIGCPQILELIQYFYPTIEIENEKYIQKIRCSLWDKHSDIQLSLDDMKSDNISNNYIEDISIYDAYSLYCKHHKRKIRFNRFVTSKSYFEKYVYEHLNSFICENGFISKQWILEGRSMSF